MSKGYGNCRKAISSCYTANTASRYLRAYTLHVHIKIIISSTTRFYHKLLPEILSMEIDNVRTGRRLLENDKQLAASCAIITS